MRLLSEAEAADLRAAPYTYLEVGATASVMPAGYRHLERSRVLPLDEFESAGDRLMSWRVHQIAGVRIAASDRTVQPDGVVELFLGPRWVGLRATCRVAYVIEEPNRVGFAYGTLPGHPETGEEAFIVERLDGASRFTIRAFSKPASKVARLGGPMTHIAQSIVIGNYLQAIAPTVVFDSPLGPPEHS